jgi:hypothetical protein
VTHYTNWQAPRDVTSAEAALKTWDGLAVLPLSRCPGSCGGEGACVAPGVCRCGNGLTGAACEIPVPTACFLSCSGADRGDCVRGVCVCHAGWFGMGCTEEVAAVEEIIRAANATGATPGTVRHRLAVHVWELPTALALYGQVDRAQGEDFPSAKRVNDYGSEYAFLYRLMNDTVHRVPTPQQANLFLVPTFSFSVTDVQGGADNTRHIERLVAFLNSTPPFSEYWARYGGGDHVFWAVGDLGACVLPDSLRNVIIASEYGHTDRTQGEEPRRQACMYSNRGIVVPSGLGTDAARMAEETYGSKNSSMQALDDTNRTTLIFFAGTQLGQGSRGYAQGVRARVAAALANVSDAIIINTHDPSTPKMEQAQMFALMRRSVFCLAPAGHGYGVRITYAMITGCIPVVIQDGVRQPADDTLPYWHFSLRLSQRDIPDIEAILRRVSPQEVRQLQARVRTYHADFVWRDDSSAASAARGGRAYEAVLESMRRKVYNAHARFADRRRRGRRLLRRAE